MTRHMQSSDKITSSAVTFSKLFIHSVMLASLFRLSFADDSPPILLSRSAHERLWIKTNGVGAVTTKFTEVATGLCRWDPSTRSWQDSNPEIEVRAGVDGGIEM